MRRRYKEVSSQKAKGATYTPRLLSDFVAHEIVKAINFLDNMDVINIFDPAVGHGQLLDSLLEKIPKISNQTIFVYGYETDENALKSAIATISSKYPNTILKLELGNFLTHVLDCYGTHNQVELFNDNSAVKYDLIIANPPYVRTQILGAENTRILSKEFGLVGRIDLYHAFIIGISEVLHPKGIAGIIVSNRFMTTKSGSAVRKAVLSRYNVIKVWDFGDTKLFDAAVLPAVLLVRGYNGVRTRSDTLFSSIYQTTETPTDSASNPIEALAREAGVIDLADGRIFRVQHGLLDSGTSSNSVWRIATKSNDKWLNTVRMNTWKTFGDIWKIRVGVKTTADKVFIRSDWKNITKENIPELLKPLITHHVARRFKAIVPLKQTYILYTHEVVNGNRMAIDITKYPKSENYLIKHKDLLERRDYVIQAGRKWYEIWVPQDPDAWKYPKLVFRDISEKPTFWIDESGAVVNGDCYWLANADGDEDIMWLAAAVANSTFIESFYDYMFCNKLYAGRRRFITQYVERFPLPYPKNAVAENIIKLTREVYNKIDQEDTHKVQQHLDELVWHAFGLSVKEISR